MSLAARPVVVITDDTTKADLAETLTLLNHRAKREMPVVGDTLHPTPWDKRHAMLDRLLADWLAAP